MSRLLTKSGSPISAMLSSAGSTGRSLGRSRTYLLARSRSVSPTRPPCASTLRRRYRFASCCVSSNLMVSHLLSSHFSFCTWSLFLLEGESRVKGQAHCHYCVPVLWRQSSRKRLSKEYLYFHITFIPLFSNHLFCNTLFKNKNPILHNEIIQFTQIENRFDIIFSFHS